MNNEPRNNDPRAKYSMVIGRIRPRASQRTALLLTAGFLAATLAACDGNGHTLTESQARAGTRVEATDGPSQPATIERVPLQLGAVRTQAATAIEPLPLLKLPERGTPVTVKGVIQGGREVTVNAERLADGTIAFIDSSQPAADRTTGKGLSVVYDGARLAKYDDLPGPVATMREGETPDVDVLSAAWAAKTTLDYYRAEHGLSSYDGKGSPLLSVVHVPEDVVGCTEYFEDGQIIATGTCTTDGKPVLRTAFDVGLAAQTTSYDVVARFVPDLFASSSGGPALLAGTADYFGTVIQNRALGTPSSTLGGSRCIGEAESYRCVRFADGTVGLRTVDSGVILDDAAFALREPRGLLDVAQQYGRRYDNGMIWTNALWQIRRAFASEDGGNPITSAAAARFDRIVFRAMTTLLPTEADLSSAAAAVAQAAVDLRATAAEQAVIQQQFVVSQLCDRCNIPAGMQQAVATTPRVEYYPSIVSGGVAYLAEQARTETSPRRTVTMFALGGDASKAVSLTPAGAGVAAMAAAGNWIVEARFDLATSKWLGLYLRRAIGGTDERMDDYNSWATPAISADTVAWSQFADGTWVLKARATSGGLVASTKLPSLPIQIGVDGSLVAYQLQDGTIGTWDLQTGKSKVLANEPGMPDSVRNKYNLLPGRIVVSGTRVAAIVPQDFYESPYAVELFDTVSGTRTVITKAALPAGLAMDKSMLVWSEVVGPQASAAAAIPGVQLPDGDLMSYSFASGTFSVLLKERGQQGFPTLGEGRLAWQDSAALGDDIYSAALPSQ